MAIQTFTAAQVLTAAQMNALQGNDYNQTVSTKTASYTLVAADKGTRVVMNSATATTITVNTSLFSAGDTLTILNIAAGVCTITAGTATVSTTGTLALVQNAGGTLYFTSAGVSVFQADGVAASASGLVRTGGGSVGTGASVAYASCFSATYNSYLITTSGMANSTVANVNATLTGLTSGYYVNSWYAAMNGAAAFNAVAYNNAAHFGPINTTGSNGSFTFITNPATALAKTGWRWAQGGSTGGYEGLDSFFNASTTAYTGLTLTCASGVFTTGQVNIYGLAES